MTRRPTRRGRDRTLWCGSWLAEGRQAIRTERDCEPDAGLFDLGPADATESRRAGIPEPGELRGLAREAKNATP